MSTKIKAFAVWVLLIHFSSSGFAQGNDYEVTKNFLGQPDIAGTWHTKFVTMLERPDDIESLVLEEREAQELANRIIGFIPHNEDPDFSWQAVNNLAMVSGEYRSSLIVNPPDGKMPFLESALEQVAYYQSRYELDFDHPEQRPLGERCLESFGGPPIFAIPLMFPYLIMQTEDQVLLYGEGAVGTRIIHLNSGREQVVHPSHEGYSTGRWEGNTLVVTTSHFRPDHAKRSGFGRPLLISPNTVVEERFTRFSDTELNYYFTITDDSLYSQPWSGEFSLMAHEGPLYEYACHEGNYSLPGILLGGQREALAQ